MALAQALNTLDSSVYGSETLQSVAAEAAHNSSPAKGHELSFSHISFLQGPFLTGYHENQWHLGSTVPLKSSLMEHIFISKAKETYSFYFLCTFDPGKKWTW